MKKQVYGRKLKRDVNERKALFRGLMAELALHERIETTEEKAKSIKGSFEKLVTKAKKGGKQAYKALQGEMHHDAVKRMVDVIGPRFAARPGGYTRIIRIGERLSDNATQVVLELVEKTAIVTQKAAKKVETAAQEKMENAAEVKTEKTAVKKAVRKPAAKKKAVKEEK